MERIVITGATGILGCALARLAVGKGMRVLAIVRPGSKRIVNLPQDERIRVVECALADYDALPTSERYDAFFHLAWDKTSGAGRDDVDAQSANIGHTLAGVRLAERLGCGVFIGAGSQAEYGIAHEPLSAKTPVNPQSAYGIAKYCAGKLSALLCDALNIRHCWARILSVYGEYDAPNTLIAHCVEQLLHGNTPSLTPCDQVWDYLYCMDAAEALLAIGESGVHQRVYCLGSGSCEPLRQYVEELRDCINPSLSLGFGQIDYYPHQPMYLCADISDLERDTGYRPRTSFSEGIRNTITWQKGQSNEND